MASLAFNAPKAHTHREHYASIGQAVNRADAVAMHDPKYCARAGEADAEWDFGAGFDGALELSRKGWPEGAARVAELARRLVELVEARVQPLATIYSDAGGYGVDVGRYLSGEPEHYLEFAETPAPKPVTLTVNLTVSSGVTAEQAFHRGACVLAAAEILTARGFAVTITGKLVNRSLRKQDRQIEEPAYVASFNVHEAGNALDRDALAFALCHPAMMRRIGFGIKEGLPAQVQAKLILFRKGRAMGYGWTTDEAADLQSPLYTPMLWTTKRHAGNAGRFDTEAARINHVLALCEAAGANVTRD